MVVSATRSGNQPPWGILIALAEKKANWAGFLRLSTYAIVGISVALIVMAVFLVG